MTKSHQRPASHDAHGHLQDEEFFALLLLGGKEHTGAHGVAMGYNYNGKLRSAEVLLKEDGSFELIRRAERPSDYFATFSDLPVYKTLLPEV